MLGKIVAARRTFLLRAFGVLALVALTAGASGSSAAAPHPASLPHFQSDADLTAYLKRLHRQWTMGLALPAAGSSAETVVVTGSRVPVSITNNQEAGVDEGDIVKLHGDTLVILRRGRLFTVSLAHHAMRPVAAVNAYPPGVNASDDWYDEMLVSGDRVIVIGYSYGRGGTEINRFHIDRDGGLAFEDAYQLRSNDYYSASNYASRLIGHRLIFYTPRYLTYDAADPLATLPGLRRWSGDAKAGFQPIGTAHEIYLSPGLPDSTIDTMHSIMTCDVAAPVMECKATSVLGPEGRTFYVSPHAVYVWVTPEWEKAPDGRAASLLYRLPLDGGAPAAIGVRGGPADQFSFREDGDSHILNVLVGSDSQGDAMWARKHPGDSVALLRLPLESFGDGSGEAPYERYRALPLAKSDGEFHNRFVGDYVLYGSGNGWDRPKGSTAVLVAVPLRGGAVAQLSLPHGVDRIEAMGPDAVVIGGDDKNVTFSAITLGGRPALGGRYVLANAAQGETRSHGFFYNPQPDPSSGATDGRYGVLGLPVARPARPGFEQLFETSAAMLYLRRTGGRFVPLGEIAAHDEGAVDDKCVASCVDWYGNARPIFIRERSFALLGYELVEGTLRGRGARETGRINFAPAAR